MQYLYNVRDDKLKFRDGLWTVPYGIEYWCSTVRKICPEMYTKARLCKERQWICTVWSRKPCALTTWTQRLGCYGQRTPLEHQAAATMALLSDISTRCCKLIQIVYAADIYDLKQTDVSKNDKCVICGTGRGKIIAYALQVCNVCLHIGAKST